MQGKRDIASDITDKVDCRSLVGKSRRKEICDIFFSSVIRKNLKQGITALGRFLLSDTQSFT